VKALLQRAKRKTVTRGKREESAGIVTSTPADGVDLTDISIRHNTIPNNEPLTFATYDFTGQVLKPFLPSLFVIAHCFLGGIYCDSFILHFTQSNECHCI